MCKIKKFTPIIFTIMLLCIQFLSVTAFAKTELESYASEINTVYQSIVRIYTPVAAVAFAFSAFRMLFTISDKNDREGTRCKKMMFYIVVATIALYALPLAINAGTSLGANYRWVPPEPD